MSLQENKNSICSVQKRMKSSKSQKSKRRPFLTSSGTSLGSLMFCSITVPVAWEPGTSDDPIVLNKNLWGFLRVPKGKVPDFRALVILDKNPGSVPASLQIMKKDPWSMNQNHIVVSLGRSLLCGLYEPCGDYSNVMFSHLQKELAQKSRQG